MGLVSISSMIFFFFTAIFFMIHRKVGKVFIPYGIATFILVMMYGNLPSVPSNFSSLYTMILLSLMIILTSVTLGILVKLFFKSNKWSIMASVITSFLIILGLFNTKGILSYIYIPVLLVAIQEYLNRFLIASNEKDKSKLLKDNRNSKRK